MRATIDPNVIVSAFMFPRSAPGILIEYWGSGAFELLVSEPLIAEYQRVLRYPHISSRHHMSEARLNRSIDLFRTRGTVVEPDTRITVVRADPDDDIVIATAVAGEADYIVSGDRHLLELGQHEGIRLVTPAVFLVILDEDL